MAKLGATVPVSLDFGRPDSAVTKPQTVALKVPVVERSSAYESVPGIKPNTATTIEDGQTATGGPVCHAALADKDLPIGGAPYSKEGDADYIDAADVKVGDLITVTFPFQGGDVVASMPVVAG